MEVGPDRESTWQDEHNEGNRRKYLMVSTVYYIQGPPDVKEGLHPSSIVKGANMVT